MQKVTLFEAQKKALDYYNSIKPQSTVHGFTKHIATNGEQTIIVPEHFQDPGTWVFKCEIRRANA
jgi:hypothetical protein